MFPLFFFMLTPEFQVLNSDFWILTSSFYATQILAGRQKDGARVCHYRCDI